MFTRYFRKVRQNNRSIETALLKNIYFQWSNENRIQIDNAQLAVLETLQISLNNFALYIEYFQKPIFHRIKTQPLKQKSLYIYGDVGRGKSMLMQLFYENCPTHKKKRFHYSQFMSDLHAFSHEYSQLNKAEIITTYAKQLSSEFLLICIDEFYVTDIADAMLLERLFTKLFALNLTIVITSNRHPNDLYQGGILKEQFLIFTQLLQKNTTIIALNSQTDYRLSYLKSAQQVFHYPLGDSSEEFIKTTYEQLTQYAPMKPYSLEVLGRTVFLTSAYQGIALTSFKELCEQPLGSHDYNLIAQHFDIIIMANIPKLSCEKRNESKRFMTLIDALYEHNVKFICSAESPAEELYLEGDGAFEFRRTVSRLIEMQAQKYLDAVHY